MRKHTFALALAILIVAPVAGAQALTPALGATEPVTISPEDLQRQVDGAALPITVIDEPF
jgi:hypothetical protein